MIMTWSAAIAAGAFVFLVAGILLALRTALHRLGQVQIEAEAMRLDLHKLSTELSRLIQPAEETIRSANRQLLAASKLFESAGHIGGAIANTTSAAERITSLLSESVEQHANHHKTKRQVGEALEWAELGMTAWQLWQTNRKKEMTQGNAHDPVSESES
ncbi:DUF948 domain-containing protein [Paenibacillus sinopodophylli]|uniref:DUF948 domain-containing protein n=1 Tax=Paenibacillus sinopodophylli TaxID=1837342 RepID=UPI00110CE5ED|nr:DUF948 domain-containing protein [Paenibacillus sinopodophylli]